MLGTMSARTSGRYASLPTSHLLIFQPLEARLEQKLEQLKNGIASPPDLQFDLTPVSLCLQTMGKRLRLCLTCEKKP